MNANNPFYPAVPSWAKHLAKGSHPSLKQNHPAVPACQPLADAPSCLRPLTPKSGASWPPRCQIRSGSSPPGSHFTGCSAMSAANPTLHSLPGPTYRRHDKKLPVVRNICLCTGKKKKRETQWLLTRQKLIRLVDIIPPFPPKRWRGKISSLLDLFKATEVKKVFRSGLAAPQVPGAHECQAGPGH